MGLEPGSGRDGVVVADDEHAMVGIGAERVNSGVERVAAVQPPDPGLMAIRAAAKAHARARDRGRTHADFFLQSLDTSSNIMEAQSAGLSSPRRQKASLALARTMRSPGTCR